ncbi:hypothetical protein K439DRAFT_1658010 [Ramaria rubella]|nr:hypothetical protein K439DRAFT_1658010 [Ramaria rubella]
MQFCMHYVFESVSKVCMMLENVSKHLHTGGVFLGTVPNADFLLPSKRTATSRLAIGNGSTLKTPSRTSLSILCTGCTFRSECLLFTSPLAPARARVRVEEFHDVFTAEREHRDYGLLLQCMKVVSTSGESRMDEDQWDAANIYLTFAFEKR